MQAVDLFSGPGGLTLGLKRAGVIPICSVERNKDAVATYKLHTPGIEHHADDIRSVDLGRYRGQADLLYGGPPCQPFSTGGLRKGSKDERDMIPAFLAAVAGVQPKVVLMENVPGLLVQSRRHYLDKLLADLTALGYQPSWRVLLAADYGVPQKRRRLFIVAFRDHTFWFPKPTHGPGGSKPHVAAGTILKHEPYGEPNNCLVSYAPDIDIRPSPYAGHVYKGGGRPIDLACPCPTVYASAGGNKTHWVDTLNIVPEYHRHLMAGGKTREGIVPGARRITVEESSLIQTFPKSMKFCGSRSSQYTQVGDAVPPLLAQVLGTAIIAQFNGKTPHEQTHYPSAETQPLFW